MDCSDFVYPVQTFPKRATRSSFPDLSSNFTPEDGGLILPASTAEVMSDSAASEAGLMSNAHSSIAVETKSDLEQRCLFELDSFAGTWRRLPISNMLTWTDPLRFQFNGAVLAENETGHLLSQSQNPRPSHPL